MAREYSDDGWGTPPPRAPNPVLAPKEELPEPVQQEQLPEPVQQEEFVEEERLSDSGFVCAPGAQGPDASVNNSVCTDRTALSVPSQYSAPATRPVTPAALPPVPSVRPVTPSVRPDAPPVEISRPAEMSISANLHNFVEAALNDTSRRSVFEMNGPAQTVQPARRPATVTSGAAGSPAAADGGLVNAVLLGLLEVVVFAGKKAAEILAARGQTDC